MMPCTVLADLNERWPLLLDDAQLLDLPLPGISGKLPEQWCLLGLIQEDAAPSQPPLQHLQQGMGRLAKLAIAAMTMATPAEIGLGKDLRAMAFGQIKQVGQFHPIAHGMSKALQQ